MNIRFINVLIGLSTLFACGQSVVTSETNMVSSASGLNTKGNTIETRFSPPAGYIRIAKDTSSFSSFLRKFPLKPVGTKVYYYNGELKRNQSVHAAVLDIDVGTRDLQQCADAVMRLRGEFLYKRGRFSDIAFNFISDGKPRYFTSYSSGNTKYGNFRKYMNYIFAYANTRSLYNELIGVKLSEMHIGDVFIQTGNPYGHAVIVVDMAVDALTNKKVYMLAQSYMPAQDIHVLKNPRSNLISPWYILDTSKEQIETPEWTFSKNDLRRFK